MRMRKRACLVVALVALCCDAHLAGPSSANVVEGGVNDGRDDVAELKAEVSRLSHAIELMQKQMTVGVRPGSSSKKSADHATRRRRAEARSSADVVANTQVSAALNFLDSIANAGVGSDDALSSPGFPLSVLMSPDGSYHGVAVTKPWIALVFGIWTTMATFIILSVKAFGFKIVSLIPEWKAVQGLVLGAMVMVTLDASLTARLVKMILMINSRSHAKRYAEMRICLMIMPLVITVMYLLLNKSFLDLFPAVIKNAGDEDTENVTGQKAVLRAFLLRGAAGQAPATQGGQVVNDEDEDDVEDAHATDGSAEKYWQSFQTIQMPTDGVPNLGKHMLHPRHHVDPAYPHCTTWVDPGDVVVEIKNPYIKKNAMVYSTYIARLILVPFFRLVYGQQRKPNMPTQQAVPVKDSAGNLQIRWQSPTNASGYVLWTSLMAQPGASTPEPLGQVVALLSEQKSSCKLSNQTDSERFNMLMTLALFRKSVLAEKKRTYATFGFDVFVMYTFFPIVYTILIPSIMVHLLVGEFGFNIASCDIDPKLPMCCTPDVRLDRYNCFKDGSTTKTRSIYQCGTNSSDDCSCPGGEVLFGSRFKYMVSANATTCDYDTFSKAGAQLGRQDAKFKEDGKAGKHSCYCRHTFDSDADPREPPPPDDKVDKDDKGSLQWQLIQMMSGGSGEVAEDEDSEAEDGTAEGLMMVTEMV